MEGLTAAMSFVRFTRTTSEALLKDFPEREAGLRIHPTHVPAVWIVGHIASTDGWFASVLGIDGLRVPDRFNTLFSGGKNAVPEAKDCPALSEVVGVFRETRAALLKWYEAAPPAAFAKDLREGTGGFLENPMDALLKTGWHEGWHFGQLASIRKALGLPNALG